MSTDTKKTPSLDIIAIIMQWGILDQGKITSLEVKNYLRSKGYFATQEAVSLAMTEIIKDSIANGHIWDIDGKEFVMAVRLETSPRSHREYFFNEINAVKPEPKVTTPAPKPVVASKMDPRGYIAAHMGLSSCQLAHILGISSASVRAYKANISRG